MSAVKFTVEITLGNDAMNDPTHVADALERVASTLRRGRFDGNDKRPVRDANGNIVGHFLWTEKSR